MSEPMQEAGMNTSRRNFVKTAAAAGGATMLGSLALAKPSGNLAPPPDYLNDLASKLGIPVALVQQHQAFLILWLLFTTNPRFVNGSCPVPDFDKLSQDLGGVLKSGDISHAYQQFQNDAGIRSTLANVGTLFNSPGFEKISGFDNPLYTGKQCPPGYGLILSLLLHQSSFQTTDPKC